MYLQFEMEPRQMCVFLQFFVAAIDIVVVLVSFGFVGPSTTAVVFVARSFISDSIEFREETIEKE